MDAINGQQGFGSKTHECEICEIDLGNATLHALHMGYHNHRDALMCNFCGIKYYDSFLFYMHTASNPHRSEDANPRAPNSISEKFECMFCEIEFDNAALHTIHMRFHNYNDAFQCNVCGDKFESVASFYVHIGQKKH